MIKLGRANTTFMKVYESPLLTRPQMERLKTAEALHEIVPICVMAPYGLVMLRFSARFQMSLQSVCRLGVLLAVGSLNYMLALECQYRAYWPVVSEVYLELHKS